MIPRRRLRLTFCKSPSVETSVIETGDGNASVQNLISITEFAEARGARSERLMDRVSGVMLEGVTAILLIALWCAPIATAAFAAYKDSGSDKSFLTVSAKSSLRRLFSAGQRLDQRPGRSREWRRHLRRRFDGENDRTPHRASRGSDA